MEISFSQSRVEDERRFAIAWVANRTLAPKGRITVMERQHVALTPMQYELVDLTDIHQTDDIAAIAAVHGHLLHGDVAAVAIEAHYLEGLRCHHDVVPLVMQPAHHAIAAGRQRKGLV